MPAERAPDTQRERVIDGQALALVERLAKLDLMDLADCNTAVRIIADALLAAREKGGYEGIANETDAARAYNDGAIRFFGEFARLNPVPTAGRSAS